MPKVKLTKDIIDDISLRNNSKTWKVIKLVSEYLGIECDYKNTSLKDLGITSAYLDVAEWEINFEMENC